MTENCILEELGESEKLFWRWKLNFSESASRERKRFSLWTLFWDILVEFLGNAGNLDPSQIVCCEFNT